MIAHLPDKVMAVDHVEKIEPADDAASSQADLELQIETVDVEPEEKEVRKLIRKIDVRLIPALAFLYAIALIDRGNLPNARLAGMDQDLGISIGDRYSILTMMFFVPYILFEFPSNLAMRKIGPAIWLGTIGILWGVVTIGMGFTHTWGTLLICRIIFGAFEAGLFPGAIYLLGSWYQRWEIQKRFTGFYVVGSVSNGFGGLLAYGIQHMEGLAGLGAWRWIFIIEGILSSVIGLIALLVLVDFPDKATKPKFWRKKSFLTDREASIILNRIARDRGDAIPEKLTLKRILTYLQDWKVWEFGLLILCNNATVYSFAYFLPIILREGFGYTLLKTYALILPPYVFGAICMFVAAWLGDKYRIRGPIVIFNSAVCVVGMSMMAWLESPSARYVGVFFGVATGQANIPSILSYQHNNIVGQMKRALATAVLVGGGGCGGIIAANSFRQQDAPNYTPGMIMSITAQALTVLLVAKNLILFSRRNREADQGKRVIEGKEGFRYTL